MMHTGIQDMVPSRKRMHNIERNTGYEGKNKKNVLVEKNYMFCCNRRRSIRFFNSSASRVSPSLW